MSKACENCKTVATGFAEDTLPVSREGDLPIVANAARQNKLPGEEVNARDPGRYRQQDASTGGPAAAASMQKKSWHLECHRERMFPIDPLVTCR